MPSRYASFDTAFKFRLMTARIGLLIPSSNTSVEPEFYRALPAEVTLHTARLYLSHISEATIAAMLAEMESQGKHRQTGDFHHGGCVVVGAAHSALAVQGQLLNNL